MLSKTPKSTTSDSDRDSSVVSLPQNDKLSHPQGKLVCHSKHCEETSPESLTTPLLCHSEGAQGATEESLNESLVAHRDSSLDSQALDMTTG
ncbi:hypothetical protein [Helicobacter marmotae]|uniref:hypothetical protein n=1 Tax=Helicobacter marmotae TaxID=152490 RepID=UPI0011C06A79|nr:hypothetical protein [Helicobacter marmotae]